MPQLFAIGYGRSSSDKQEASCPQQREWGLRKAAALGAELVGWHEDDGIPGDRLDRPGLEAVFADLEQHMKARRPVAVLLAFDQDRLSRATSWATGAIMERLMRFGVERLVTATEEVDLYDDGGRVIFGLKQDLSKRGYAKQLSKNVCRGMASLAAAGWWAGGPAPYGYRIAGERRQRQLVFGPAEEVEAVKELFRLAAEGRYTLGDLARLANERKWPLPPCSEGRQRGRAEVRWTGYTVGHILHKVAYVGLIRYGKRRKGKYHQAAEGGPIERRGPSQEKAPAFVCQGKHEPLVDRATFDRVQAVLAARQVGRKGGRPRPLGYIFSGRLVCGSCGQVMQGRDQDGFHGYVCSTYRHGEGCARNSVAEDDLVERVAALLTRELGTQATINRLRKRLESKRSGRGEALRLAVERGKKHVADLAQQVEAGGRQLLRISPDLVPLAEKELRRQMQELEAAKTDLADIEKQAATCLAEDRDIEELLAQLVALPELLRNATPEKRCRIVQLAVSSIRLRFDLKVGPSGRKLSKWTGATVGVRGDGPSYEMTVGGQEAPAPRGRRLYWLSHQIARRPPP
jgi:DNA invertase Pin-like site-specific DNA recombinase